MRVGRAQEDDRALARGRDVVGVMSFAFQRRVIFDAPDTATVRGRARKLLSGPLELWGDDGSHR